MARVGGEDAANARMASRDASIRLNADYSDGEETPEAASKRREAAASNLDPNAVDEDAELDDFALSSDDEDGGAVSGKEPELDRAMMNELLLVCSNLGMLRVQNEGEEPVLMRGEDCEEWIHDLQRAIRRDHAKHKLVAKQLGKWKILQKKLVPLLVNHQHDWSLVFSILKVLVMLTMKPTKESTNIAQQLKYLRAYKYAFLRHDIVPILMTILVDPLSRKGSARTAQDYLNMELVLTLIRNVLAIPNEDPRFVTSTTTYLSHLQEDFIQTLHEENVYEMILLFAQDIESAENREWNLLIMEMMDLTLDCSHPKAVAAFAKQSLAGAAGTGGQSPAPQRPVQPSHSDSLTQKLNSEKLSTQQRNGGSRRHSNFGGVLTLVGPTGRSTLLTNFSKTPDDQIPQAAKKPVARKRGGRQRAAPVATDISEIFGSRAKVTESDRSTMSVLMEICDTLISKCYFQLTNSLKNEFRRGSSKLVSTDRLQYFHLVWFLTTYHRLKLQALKSHYRHQLKEHEKKKNQLLQDMDFHTPAPPEKPVYDEKAVLSTLDMFSFNFILQSIETYASVKNYHGMSVSVQLLTEMMAYLSELGSSDDSRYQRIADSLQHKILYERDFLDRIPVLLKTWSPGIFTKEYVVDVVTLSHLVFKMLDAQGNIKVLSRRKAYLENKKKKGTKRNGGDEDGEGADSDSDDEEETERQAQLLLEMQRKEADFDVRKYFQSILSSDTIKMYCFLLSSYRENNAKVNHYIHSFFYRAKHFKIHQHEEWTMQPLLFNIHVLLLFNKMLQDPLIHRQSEFKSFLDFIRGVVRDFFTLAEKNHLLFVEALLRQPYAAKSAMLLQRNYEPLDSMAKSRSDAVALGREKQIAIINEVRRHKKAVDAEDLEGEEEFQFTLAPSDFQSSSLVASGKNKSRDGEDSNSAEEVGFGGPNAPPTAAAASKSASAAEPKQKSKAATERAKNWTKVEDRYLEKMFMKYRHLPSVYEVISYEDMFQDRDRTAEQIERRVKYLKLHRKTHDSSDEEEGGGDNAEEREKSDDEGNESDFDLQKELTVKPVASPESSRPRRRLRRVTTLSDDSDNDDDLLQGGDNLKQRSPFAHFGDSTSASNPGTSKGDLGEHSNDMEETDVLREEMDSVDEEQTQIINDGTEDPEDAQMTNEQTQDINQEGTQMVDGDETQAADDAATDAPTTQALEDSVDAETTDAVESNEVGLVAEEETPASNKRARDPSDVGDDDASASPQKNKIARAAPLDEEEESASIRREQ